jgi:hypothetical protein
LERRNFGWSRATLGSSTSSPAVARAFDWRDVLVLLALGGFGFAYQLGRWGGTHPFPFLFEDASNIASFAAAIDHPDRFVRDPFLGDPTNFGFYVTLHVPLLRALNAAIGDYGTAFISLLGFHVFLQASGFYLLGRVLFRDRFWALLLAVITLPLVWINLAEYWGIFWDPQPRFTYQAALPFALAATIAWRDQPRRFPWLMVAAALLVYAHPVSAPSWAFAIWLSLWARRPDGWSRARQTRVMIGLGLLFLALAAPFAVLYLGEQSSSGADCVAPADLQAAVAATFHAESLDVGMALGGFVASWSGAELLFWILAGFGVTLLTWLPGAHRGPLAMVGLWCCGLLAIGVGLPWVDQVVARMRGTLPFEIDLIRSIRYLVPLMLLLVIWPLAAIYRRARSRTVRLAVAAAGLALTAFWVELHPIRYVGDAVACWARGRLSCPAPGRALVLEAFERVRTETPPGARLFATSFEVALRYATLRPVVYSPTAPYVKNHPVEFLRWQEDGRRIRHAQQLPEPQERIAALIETASALGADYALIDSRYLPPGLSPKPGDALVWRNNAFALVRLPARIFGIDPTQVRVIPGACNGFQPGGAGERALPGAETDPQH